MRKWINLVESAQPPKTLSFDELYHVGEMDPARKGTGSYEGEGLSVSLHPETWMGIAHIGGDLWRLTKPGNHFLDYHSLANHRDSMIAWGIAHGWIEDRVVFRAQHYDDETEKFGYMTFLSRKEAEDETGFEDDDGNIHHAPIEEVHSQVGTEKLKDRCRHREIDLDPHQLLATVWADDTLGLDGVWFADDLDPVALSAPRGVIFVSRLPEWHVERTDQWPDEDEYY